MKGTDMFKQFVECVKALFKRKDRRRTNQIPPSYKKNVVYNNDAQGEARVKGWLDEIASKHHGG